MKSKTKLLFLVLALTTVGASGCGGSSGDNYNYTYNTYLQTKPKTWNTHNWESSDESYINSFTEMGFYDLALNETMDGYVIVPEMAAANPVDVTEEQATPDVKDLYDYKGNLSEGYIWDIALNPAACWEDGTPITADDYVQSMERQLDPKMVNFRADSYYASSFVIAGAEKYFKQGRETLEALFNYINDDGSFTTSDIVTDGYYYINIAAPSPYPGSVFSGTDGSESLYTVLNNRSSAGSDSLELAAQRITDACRYFAWKYCDHEGDYKTDWEEITGYAKLSSITEEMLVPHYMKLDDFDNYEVYARSVKDQSGEEYAELYTQADLKKDLSTVVVGLSRGSGKTANKDHAWKCPLFGNLYNDYEADFNSVGIKKVDDHKIRLFLGRPTTMLDLQFSLTSNWLVKVDLYDSLKVNTGGLIATGYASPDKGVKGYMSYGPYRLDTFEAGKSFKIVKNEKWYGYTDGKHVDQYVMDCLYTRIIEDHNTALQEFLAGRLDDIGLNRTDMKTYGNSSRLTSTYESYTQKISFNSDFSSLASRQKESGKNKTVISNYNFRKGLSLALNRNDYASQATAGAKGFTGLLNDLYLTDIQSGEMYRNTTQGKSVYQAVYGDLGGTPDNRTALPESETGYNFEMATYYVAEGIKEELANEHEKALNVNDTIELEFRVYDNESESTIDAMNFLIDEFSEVIAAAVTSLKAQGVLTADQSIKFSLKTVKDEDYYNSAHKGNYDLIFSTWGGAAINPIGLMQVYCDSTFTSCCEYGFKGKQNNTYLDIDVNGNGVIDSNETKTFHTWWTEASSITENAPRDSQEWKDTHNRLLTILAGLEAGILNRFEAVPVVARATASLNSFKIENGTTSYINLIGYGGIRHLKFNYTNAEWNEFLKEYGDRLADLYKQ